MRTFGRRLLEFLKRQSPVHIAVGLGALYFLIQLAFIHRYGVTWDEPHHRMWGKLFAEYVRTGDRRSLLQILGHGLYYSPLYFFAEYLTSKWIFATGLLTFVASNHVLNLLTASVGVGTLFVFATLVGGRVLGLLSVLFIVFFPPFIAHSHYNPKDIPLMTALLLTGVCCQEQCRCPLARETPASQPGPPKSPPHPTHTTPPKYEFSSLHSPDSDRQTFSRPFAADNAAQDRAFNFQKTGFLTLKEPGLHPKYYSTTSW